MLQLHVHDTAGAGSGSDLQALVAQIQQTATEAADVVLAAIATQIRELAAAATAELAEVRRCAADAPGDPTDAGNLGEGFWEVALAAYAAKDVARYAHEAQLWVAMHAHALARREQGLAPFCWEDTALQRQYDAVEEERDVSERNH